MEVGDKLNVQCKDGTNIYVKRGTIVSMHKYGVLVEFKSGVKEFYNIADFIVKDKINVKKVNVENEFNCIKKVGHVVGFNKIDYVYKRKE